MVYMLKMIYIPTVLFVIFILSFDSSLAQTAEEYLSKGFLKSLIKKDYKGAMLDYNKAIELEPNNPEAYIGRGSLKAAMGNDEHFSIVKISSVQGQTKALRGAIKDYEDSLKDYNKAIELDPNNPEAYHERGSVKDKMGNLKSILQDKKGSLNDYKSALKDYNKAIELDPNKDTYYFYRGSVKSELGDYPGAIKDYNRLIKAEPKNADYYLLRGANKVWLGQKESGCLDLSKAGEMGAMYAYDVMNEGCK